MIRYGAGIVRMRGKANYVYLPLRMNIAPGSNVIFTAWPDGEEMTIDNLYRVLVKVIGVSQMGNVAVNIMGLPYKKGDRISFKVEDYDGELPYHKKDMSYLHKSRRKNTIPVPEELLEDDA